MSVTATDTESSDKENEFGLPLRVRKTAVTVDGPKITLRNASLKIGHSDMVATGEVMGLYRALLKFHF